MSRVQNLPAAGNKMKGSIAVWDNAIHAFGDIHGPAKGRYVKRPGDHDGVVVVSAREGGGSLSVHDLRGLVAHLLACRDPSLLS